MDLLLRLPPALENQFWSSDSCRKQQRILDQFGLLLGLLTNTLWSNASSRCGMHVAMRMTFCVQVAHLTWLWSDTASYMRWRLVVALAQRFRWLAVFVYSATTLATESMFDSITSQVFSATGNWKLLVGVIGLATLPFLLNSINHPLSFRLQLIFSFIITALYLQFALPHQLRAIEMYDLRKLIKPSCQVLHSLLCPAAPAYEHSNQQLCSSNNAELLLIFMFLLIAVILPLTVMYWHEYSCKVAFLRQCQEEGTLSDLHITPLSPPVCTLGILSLCIAAWASVGVWTSARAAIPAATRMG